MKKLLPDLLDRDYPPVEVTEETRELAIIMGQSPSVVVGANRWFNLLRKRAERKKRRRVWLWIFCFAILLALIAAVVLYFCR